MALKVTTSSNKTTVKVVTNDGGMQGSSYNPQKTAPSTVLQSTSNPQKTAPARVIQPAGSSSVIQPAMTAQQIQAIAEQQRKIVEAEQKKQRISNFNNTVSTNISSKINDLRVKAYTAGSIIARQSPAVRVEVEKKTQYQVDYEKAYSEALAEFDSQVKANKSGFSKLWDKFTFGEDRRAVGAREYARKRAEEIMDRDFSDYETSISIYETNRATAQDLINRSAQTMTESEFNNLVQTEQAKLDTQYNDLMKKAAMYEGRISAFSELSQKPLTSFATKALTKVATSLDTNPLFKYTLGSGGKNIPSLVTAPSRVINFFGNINTKDREIYKYGGGFVKRTETGENAWQSTYNQRNLNLRPWTDRPFNKDDALKWINGQSFGSGQYSNTTSGSVQQISLKRKYNSAKTEAEKQKVLEQAWAEYNRSGRLMNSGKELALDPMNLLGGAGVTSKILSKAKGMKFVSKIDDFRLAKLAQFSETRTGKALKWLTSEYENPSIRKTKFIEEELDDIARKKPAVRDLAEKWISNKGQIKAGVKNEITQEILADFGKMSNSQVKIFQKFFDAGDWTFKNASRVKNKEKYVELAKKYAKIFDDLQQSENLKGIKTPYRQKYLPNYGGRWSATVRKAKKLIGRTGDDAWWFTKPKEKRGIQGKKQFVGSMSARQYHSRLARRDLPVLKDLVGGSEDIGRNLDRIKDVDKFIKPTRFERLSNVAGIPGKLWKKAVLLGNPAWYVNNELFNQISGITSGGLKFIKNQRGTAKYLDHITANAKNRMLPSEANSMVRDIASNISNETGRSFLSKIATKQENRARIALYRTFRQNGLDHASAVKKLNRNLFDYSTKNYERPIKSIIPFWSFQKNIAKRAVTLPFENPRGAMVYNRVDREQKNRFEKEFETVAIELEKLGYTEDEIQQVKEQQEKYFGGKLMIGRDKSGNPRFINTPFNAFSEKQTAKFGINPWINAVSETAQSKDQFGNSVKGSESTLFRRLLSKFPQADLVMQFKKKLDVDRGILKPSEKYIGKSGSGGYGLGKEKQGYDSTRENYNSSLDPRRNFIKNVLSFAGVPRSTTFDKAGTIQNKRLQKVTETYFNTDWKSMPFEEQQKSQTELFKKFGVTPDEFYKGILSKYDTDNTKKIKVQKEEARIKNQSLLEEYQKQPIGTRSIWAVKKMHELADSGYFKDNPFLYSFVKGGNIDKTKGWLSPSTIDRAKKSAEKKSDYEYASRTNDWSIWRKKYGTKNKYVAKQSPYQTDGKFFKSAESMQRYKEGSFWKRYAEATKADRKKLLADNPEFNTRANWTAQDWQEWKSAQRKEEVAKVSKKYNFGSISDRYLRENKKQAGTFFARRQRKSVAFKYKLS